MLKVGDIVKFTKRQTEKMAYCEFGDILLIINRVRHTVSERKYHIVPHPFTPEESCFCTGFHEDYELEQVSPLQLAKYRIKFDK